MLTLASISYPGHTSLAQELTDEEIFEKAFKKKANTKPVQIPIPVYYENNPRPLTQIQARMGTIPEDLQMESDPIMRVLENLVEAPLVFRPVEIQGAELVEKDPDSTWIPISSFRSTPYRFVFDEKKLEIRIFIPPEARKKGRISVAQKTTSDLVGTRIEPENFSSYLNLLANQNYQYTSTRLTGSDGRQPLRASLQHGAHLKGYVLESSFDFHEPMFGENLMPTWRRGDVKLVKDYPETLLRQTIGDLQYGVRGFQSYRALGGINFSSQFSMDSSKLTIATGNYEIFLKRPSKVEIWINEELRQTLDLPAGRHDLRNFPFANGANDLKLEITDDLGQRETLTHTYFSSSDLLAPGVNEVSYSLGLPWQAEGFGRTYDTSMLTSSIFHRRGISETLTLGANALMDPTYLLLGGEAVFPVWSGLINLEPALSKGERMGLAFRTRYVHMNPKIKEKRPRSFALGLESRSPRFSLSGQPLTTIVPVAHSMTGSFGWSLTDNTTGNMGLNYRIVRKSQIFPHDSWSVSLGMSRQWKDGPSASVNLREQKLSTGRMEVSLTLGLSMSFKKERQRVSASYNLRDDATRLDWSYASPHGGADSMRVRAGVRRNIDSRGFESSVDYVANRANLGLNHFSRRQELRSDQGGGTYGLTNFNLQLGTALVYAGGKFALSRPVTDSFVIVAPEKNLKGELIQLNPRRDDTFIAETGPLGAAAITELPSYSHYTLRIAGRDIKDKIGMPSDQYLLHPRYRSGYVISLGTDLSLYLGGKFLFEDGNPLASQPGRVRSLSDPDWPSVTFFTSRSGRARMEGFKPGRYELVFFESDLQPATFEIPKTDSDLFDLGDVIIRRKE